MKIYLDVCCLNRPFDDQTQERVHLETEAIEFILLRFEKGDWRWVGSEAVVYEVNHLTNMDRRFNIFRLMSLIQESRSVNGRNIARSDQLIDLGFKALDALHVACAEDAKADVFLTTDDRLQKTAMRNAKILKVRVANPLTWLEEQIL
jgi:predicted nucleic acid-binding protein